MADFYDYHPSKQLYLDNNSMMSSFEMGGTNVGDLGTRQPEIQEQDNQQAEIT